MSYDTSSSSARSSSCCSSIDDEMFEEMFSSSSSPSSSSSSKNRFTCDGCWPSEMIGPVLWYRCDMAFGLGKCNFGFGLAECLLRERREENIIVQPAVVHRCISRRWTAEKWIFSAPLSQKVFMQTLHWTRFLPCGLTRMRCSLRERRLRADAEVVELLVDELLSVWWWWWWWWLWFECGAGAEGRWLVKLLLDESELSEMRAMDSVEAGNSVGERDVVERFNGEQRRLRFVDVFLSISLLLISGRS